MLNQVCPSHVCLKISRERGSHCQVAAGSIRRMVLNLVRNSSMAFEGRDTGKINVSVSILRASNAEKSAVCIEIEDDGVGMDDETKERAIEPYFSIRGSTGLGLSTVHGLIEQAGGTLEY